MEEEKEYEVKPVEKKAKDKEDKIDQKIREETPPSKTQPIDTQQPPQTRRKFQVPKIPSIPKVPADKIFKTMTNKEMMMQTLHDETLEPHVHLTILLFIVFILAIIITLIGMILGM